ncbi:hypothetical protein A3K89_04115 [Rhodococcoides kyotonense]|uniref:Uncharacterized protein n=2 Tax=Mycobacteriales TaxID=85007 RepID=A0A177YHF8_9NOCA|nr:hypothetical protein A3K89_04115 [Rhodococcus kyotonensis]
MNYLAQQPFTATSVAIIRMKVIAACKSRGVEVTTIDGMTLRMESGFTMGLHNLVQRCSVNDRRHWDDMIEFHVTTTLETQRLSNPEYLLNMPDDEFYMRLRERVVPPEILSIMNEYSYSSPLVDAPGSPRRVLNLSFPNLALNVADRYLANRDLSAAWAFGRENTAAVKFETYESMLKDDVAVEVRRGDSIYLASKVANMPRFLADELGDAPFGVLFAVPSAYEIDCHRLRSHDEAQRAADLLLELAVMLSTDTPSQLSSEVFFWRDDEYCQVSRNGVLEPTGHFDDTLRELADG